MFKLINKAVSAVKAAFKKAVQLVTKPAAAVATGGMVLAGSARAALPEEVSTAITAYSTDALAAIGLVMAAGVAIWGLRKLASKMGWL